MLCAGIPHKFLHAFEHFYKALLINNDWWLINKSFYIYSDYCCYAFLLKSFSDLSQSQLFFTEKYFCLFVKINVD